MQAASDDYPPLPDGVTSVTMADEVSMPSITVVVADPEEERRAACLRRLAPERGIRVVAETGTAAETLGAARQMPRILLIDSTLAVGRGLALLHLFRRSSPDTRILVLTGHTSHAALLDAIAHGAHGCLNRRQIRAFLPKAVRKMDQGEPWVSRKMVPGIIEALMRMGANGPANSYG
jgi:DNA-binding NarL/FixJ family response regulator